MSRKRHLAKTVTWRIIGTIDTIILGWIITGEVNKGLAIGGVEVISKMGLYYLHERAWYKIKFGLTSKENSSHQAPEKTINS
jgi:uncharacterized membrane protein